MVMKTEIDNLTNNKENIVLVPGTKAATLFGKLLDKDRIISEDLEKMNQQLNAHDAKRLEIVGLINALTGAKQVTQELLNGYIIDVSQEKVKDKLKKSLKHSE